MILSTSTLTTIFYSLSTLFLFLIRYSWLFILTLITEFIFYTNNYFPKYTELYQSVVEKMVDWEQHKMSRRVLSRISIWIVPFILESCFIWSLPWLKLLIFVVRKLSLFLIIYSWLLLIILTSKILEENHIFLKYTRIYRFMVNKLNGWIGCSDITFLTIAIFVSAIPTIVKHVKNGLMSIGDLLLLILIIFTLFIMVYCSSMLTKMFNYILGQIMMFLENIENYYEPIINKLYPSISHGMSKFAVIAIAVLVIPMLFEQVKVGSIPVKAVSISMLLTIIFFIIRYSWMMLIPIINAISSQSKIASKVRSIINKNHRWVGHNNLISAMAIIVILAIPPLFEHITIQSISIRKRFESILITFVYFMIRHYWLALIMIMIEILQENIIFEKGRKQKRSVVNKIHRWPYRNIIEFTIAVAVTLVIQLFSEHFTIGSMRIREIFVFIFIIVVPLIIRYFWLILIIIMSKILKEKNIFPTYTRNYRSILETIDGYVGNNDFKCTMFIIVILAIPPLCEHVQIQSKSIRELCMFNLITLVFYIVRYCWLILTISITVYLEKNMIFPTYVKEIKIIMKEFDDSGNHNNLKFAVVFLIFIAIPPVLELVQIRPISIGVLFMSVLPTLILSIIRSCWLLPIIGMSEIFSKNELFPQYTEKYEAAKKSICSWIGTNNNKKYMIIFAILVGPFLLEMIITWFTTIIDLVFRLLWYLCLFSIRYLWLLMIVIDSEILEEAQLYPNYVREYRRIKRKIDNWISSDIFKLGIVIYFILFTPLLLEIFLFNVLVPVTDLMISLFKMMFSYLLYGFIIYFLYRLTLPR